MAVIKLRMNYYQTCILTNIIDQTILMIITLEAEMNNC